MNNFNMLTIIVIAILALAVWLGWKKGLVRTILSLCSLIISLVLVWILFPHVSSILEGFTPLRDTVYEHVDSFLSEEISELLEQLPETDTSAQNELIDKLPLPEELKEKLSLNNNVDVYEALGVESFTEYLSTTVTNLILQAASLLLTLIIVFIAVHLLIGALDLVAKLPGLNAINKSGGAIAGLITGYLIVQIIFLVITVFSGTGWGKSLMVQVNESAVLTFLYNSSATIKMLFSELTKSFAG